MPSYYNDEYDIEKAFRAIEDELMNSMIRNLDDHRAEEEKEGYNWSAWQTEQLKALEKYKQENKLKFSDKISDINKSVGVMIQDARTYGSTKQEVAILKAIQKGFKPTEGPPGMEGSFFRLNTRKLEALTKATTDDLKKGETAMLRMANDKYRQIIFNAQVYANTGAGTYEKAVDMATKDFLSAGINCIEYKNGARHTLSEYSKMAIQTANKRAYLTGEGEKRQEWGITTVIMNKRGNACPKCLPFVGKILIDDVWSGGKAADGPYPLMSSAIAAGLYHPRCKDSHTTYFPDSVDESDATYTQKDLKKIESEYKRDQEQLYAQRQADKFERLEKYSLAQDNKTKYGAKARAWGERASVDNSFVYDSAPVYYDKCNDYEISLPSYPDDVNKGLTQAAVDLAKKGSEDRCEHMHLVNLETGDIEYYETNGEASSVGIDFWKKVEANEDKTYAFVHNHNITSSLSLNDLLTPVLYQNVPIQIAVQNDGMIYIAERTKDSVKGFYPDLYYEKELEELNKLSRSGKITPDERMKKREQLIVKVMQDEFYEKGVVIADGRRKY